MRKADLGRIYEKLTISSERFSNQECQRYVEGVDHHKIQSSHHWLRLTEGRPDSSQRCTKTMSGFRGGGRGGGRGAPRGGRGGRGKPLQQI